MPQSLLKRAKALEPSAPRARQPRAPESAAQTPFSREPNPAWTHAHQHYLQRTVGNQAATRHLAQQSGALVVAPDGDPFEQQAEEVAHRVTQEGDDRQQPAQVTQEAATSALQRAPEGEAAGGPKGGALSDGYAQRLERSRAGGQSLDGPTRAQMESSMGADFGGVRVHTGAQADGLSRAINADAFTAGRDIFFRDGVYQPKSEGGRQVLAHELTHVVQQGGAPGQIQRLTSAAAFQKSTRLTARKGKSSSFIAGVIGALRAYEGPLAGQPLSVRIKHLQTLSQTIAQWLKDRGSKSSRRAQVFALRTEVENELFALRQKFQPLQGTEFTDANVARAEDAKYGDAMNKLDELVYNFSVEEDEHGNLQKVPGGEFVALFKEQLANDPIGARGGGQAVGHRGAGIPKVNPRFAERNVAMQVIDKLLGANVVPATFMAQHAGKQGFIMEKVKGKTGRELGAGKLPEEKQFATDAMANPLVREGLSKIYLLDLICAQVDRHPGNYMVVIEEGVIKGVKAIDNDLAFGKDVDIDELMQLQGNLKQWRRMGFIGPLADELKEIDKNFAQKIIDLSKTPDVLRNALQGLLTPEEIEKTVDRLNSLALFLQPLLTQNSPIVKTKWE